MPRPEEGQVRSVQLSSKQERAAAGATVKSILFRSLARPQEQQKETLQGRGSQHPLKYKSKKGLQSRKGLRYC